MLSNMDTDKEAQMMEHKRRNIYQTKYLESTDSNVLKYSQLKVKEDWATGDKQHEWLLHLSWAKKQDKK